MSLIQLKHVDVSMGGPLLLNQVNLSIGVGERICIVGRNGEGKSTLLKLIAGELEADGGTLHIRQGTVIAHMRQEVPADITGTVFTVIAAKPDQAGQLLTRDLPMAAVGHLTAPGQKQPAIETSPRRDLERHVGEIINRLELPANADFTTLSGGMKRRVMMARALVRRPDVLLLDEPTNHLDIQSIAWLECFMKSFAGCLVFVTHDRQFLRALATRIVEIDRGTVTAWPGDYDNYLRRRGERLHAEFRAKALFDKKLAREEAWIRQGIKARRTRNEGRVRALKAHRNELAQQRQLSGHHVHMTATMAHMSGKKVIELKHIRQHDAGRVLIDDLSTTIMRGDRVGLIGPNGSGKSTLLGIMLTERIPQSGTVTLGSGLDIACFDQHRLQLDDRLNALDNVAEGRQFIELNGKRRHVIGYMSDFLFSPERAHAPINRLSGGERNRLLLAKLFSKPSNLLAMDEPTNDLDVKTLTLLEKWLADYPGTLVLISHDRAFLDNVVSRTLVLEGHGKVGEYIGGYSDWLRQRPNPTVPVTAATERSVVAASTLTAKPAPTPRVNRKRSYRDQRELNQIPARIEQLEFEIAARNQVMSEADFFRQDSASIIKAQKALKTLQQELEAAYARWLKLAE